MIKNKKAIEELIKLMEKYKFSVELTNEYTYDGEVAILELVFPDERFDFWLESINPKELKDIMQEDE